MLPGWSVIPLATEAEDVIGRVLSVMMSTVEALSVTFLLLCAAVHGCNVMVVVVTVVVVSFASGDEGNASTSLNLTLPNFPISQRSPS